MTMVTANGKGAIVEPIEGLPLGRDSIAWKVNAEPVVFAGGGRALLLQVAHPAVGAGVEQHSSYANDPWGRLMRTVDIMLKLSFGTPEQSVRQQRVLLAMHRRVEGMTDDGQRYHALDPDLLLWVWATLAETALRMYERTFGRLPEDERRRFYEESCLVARGCAVPEHMLPANLDQFEQYVQRVIDEDLRVTDAARAVAVATSGVPLPGPIGRVASGPTGLVTAGMLPPSLRAGFGFDWSPARERRLEAFFTTTRVACRVTPAVLRRAPAEITVLQRSIPKVPRLRRIGADITGKRLRDAGFDTAGVATARAGRAK